MNEFTIIEKLGEFLIVIFIFVGIPCLIYQNIIKVAKKKVDDYQERKYHSQIVQTNRGKLINELEKFVKSHNYYYIRLSVERSNPNEVNLINARSEIYKFSLSENNFPKTKNVENYIEVFKELAPRINGVFSYKKQSIGGLSTPSSFQGSVAPNGNIYISASDSEGVDVLGEVYIEPYSIVEARKRRAQETEKYNKENAWY